MTSSQTSLLAFLLVAVTSAATGMSSSAGTLQTTRMPAVPGTRLPQPAANAATREVLKTAHIKADVADVYERLPLGSSIHEMAVQLGRPWSVGHSGDVSYWTYPVESSSAWLVVTLRNGRVEAEQFASLLSGGASPLSDAVGSRLGESLRPDAIDAAKAPARDVALATEMRGKAVVHRWDDDVYLTGGAAGIEMFAAVDSAKRITRFGRTRGLTDVVSVVLVPDMEGVSPLTPVAVSDMTQNTASGRAAYAARQHGRLWYCPGGESWTAHSEATINYANVPEIAVKTTCASEAQLFRVMYFAATAQMPRPFDADQHSQREISGLDEQSLPRMMRPRERIADSSPTPAPTESPGALIVAFQTNGYRSAGRNAAKIQELFQFNDDPNHPLQGVVLYPAAPTPQPYVSSFPQSDLRSSVRDVGPRPNVSSTVAPFTPIQCSSLGGDWIECNGSFNAASSRGQFCSIGVGTFGTGAGSYTTTTPIDCQIFALDNRDLPNCHPCDSEVGRPFDVKYGTLSYEYDDAKLSGPFGLDFRRKYESDLSNYQGDLGLGWRSSYDAYLDLSTTSKNALVTFYDSEGSRTYFESTGPGTYFYDQTSGATLRTNTDGTYTVETWTHQQFTFDALGRLSVLRDRNGNAQTIARDTSGRIQSVTDWMGKSLTFGYNGTNGRITTVTSNPAGVSLSLTYDNGTNCSTGNLCSVRESDGGLWSYQYQAGYSGGMLLTEVVNPNGHAEEVNSYTSVTRDDGAYEFFSDYVLSEQYNGLTQDDLKLTVGSDSNERAVSTIVDTPASGVSNTSSFAYDVDLNEITSKTGFECHCGDDTLSYHYDVFDRMLTRSEPSGSSTPTQSYSYGRDLTYVIPQSDAGIGGTGYLTAYPGPTQITDYGVPQRVVNLTYEPFNSYFPDKIAVQSEASVPRPAASAALTYTYNNAGLVTKLVQSGYVGSTVTSYTSTWAWDSNGRLMTSIGPRTDVTQKTSYVYFPSTDSDIARRGQLSTVTDALGHVTKYAAPPSGSATSYSIYGTPDSVSDANNVNWLYTFDTRGRILSYGVNPADSASNAHLPGQVISKFSFDPLGNLSSSSETLGRQAFAYDSSERLMTAETTTPGATPVPMEIKSFGYDAESEQTSVTSSCSTSDPSCAASSSVGTSAPAFTSGVTYDAFGAVASELGGSVQGASAGGGLPTPAPAGPVPVATFSYSTRGDLTESSYLSSPSPDADLYGYDAFHQQTMLSHGPSSQLSSSITYDSQHNIASVSPTGGGTTAYNHDDFGRVTSKTSAVGGNWAFVYDAAGNVTSATDPNGSVTIRTYDALNRPLTAKSTKGSATESVSWAYDNTTSGAYGIGRLASMSDPSGTTTMTYEPRGLVTSEVRVINSVSYTTGYTYDVDGDLATETLPSGRVVTYAYDYAHRPVSLKGVYKSVSTTYVAGAQYLPFGPASQLTYGNGVVQTWRYNQRYLPLEDKIVHSGATLSDVAYAENNLGQIVQQDDLLQPTYNRTNSYGTSNLPPNALAGVTTGSGLWTTASFDGSSNHASDEEDLVSAKVGATSLTLTYDSNERVNGMSTNGAASVPATSDAAGNQLTILGATYTYSPRNLLATGEGITYAYNGFGQRVLSTKSSNVQASLYDESGDLTSESSSTSGSIAYDYIWFNGRPVAQETIGASPSVVWTHTNELGAPFLQTGSTGAVSWQVDYAPYGSVYKVRTGSQTLHQPLRLPGQEAVLLPGFTSPNGSSQLFYNNHRWYMPSIGRYVSADPTGYSADPYNLFAYTANNPANLVDRSGLWVGADDGVATLGGAAIALVTLIVTDLWTGHVSTPAQIAAAGITGAVAGESSLYGGPFVGGLAGGFVGSVLGQEASGGCIDYGRVAESTLAGGVLGGALGAVAPRTAADFPINFRPNAENVQFGATTNSAGGVVAIAPGPVNALDVQNAVQVLQQGDSSVEVTVLSGTHGSPDGEALGGADSTLFDEDVAINRANKEGSSVTVIDIGNMSDDALSALMNQPGNTVAGFCWSSQCYTRLQP